MHQTKFSYLEKQSYLLIYLNISTSINVQKAKSKRHIQLHIKIDSSHTIFFLKKALHH